MTDQVEVAAKSSGNRAYTWLQNLKNFKALVLLLISLTLVGVVLYTNATVASELILGLFPAWVVPIIYWFLTTFAPRGQMIKTGNLVISLIAFAIALILIFFPPALSISWVLPLGLAFIINLYLDF